MQPTAIVNHQCLAAPAVDRTGLRFRKVSGIGVRLAGGVG